MEAIIRLLVQAPTRDRALSEADAGFAYSLVSTERERNGLDGPFLWGAPLHRDHPSIRGPRPTPSQGEPLAFRVVTDRGHREVEKAWSETRDALNQTIDDIGEALRNRPNEDIIEDAELRFTMSSLDPFTADPLYRLYDGTKDGLFRPIHSFTEYHDLMDRIEANDWVVPFIARY